MSNKFRADVMWDNAAKSCQCVRACSRMGKLNLCIRTNKNRQPVNAHLNISGRFN